MDTSYDMKADCSAFEHGTSPSQLQDVKKAHNISSNSSLSNSLCVRTREQSQIARRSMREYEEQVATLNKENFNLKLRVYFLEERDAGGAREDSCIKQNIELKIQVESLKNDLDLKQELIEHAAKAIEIMEESQKETAREYEEKNNLLLFRISELEDELKLMTSKLKDPTTVDDSGCTNTANSSFTEGSDELSQKQNAIADLENQVYGLQTELISRESELTEVQKNLEDQTKKLNEKELLIQQKCMDIAQLQNNISSYKTQIANLQETLQIKETELKSFQEQAVTSSGIISSGEPNLIKNCCGLNKDDSEIQRLRNLLIKRNDVIQKHEDAHRCACIVIQTFMKKNKEMSRQLDSLKKQKSEVTSNSPPLPQPTNDGITAQQSESADSQLPFKSATNHVEYSNLSEDARHEREGEEDRNEIDSVEHYYKLYLQTKVDSSNELTQMNQMKNEELNDSKEMDTQKVNLPKKTGTQIKSVEFETPSDDFLHILEENKKLISQIEDLKIELRNTPERDNENVIKQMRKEVLKYKDEYETLKTELHNMQITSENMNQDNLHWQEVCFTLKEHLEELAGFLNSLLRSDMCTGIIGERLDCIKQAINRSLDLSRSVALSVSAVGREGNSLIQLSSLSAYLETSVQNAFDKADSSNSNQDNIILDQAEMISNLQKEISYMKKQMNNKHSKQKLNRSDLDASESETWSEPDKDVSFARIGLQDLSPKRKSNISKCSQRSSYRRNILDESHDCEKLQEHIKSLQLRLTENDKNLLENKCALLKSDNELQQEKLRMASEFECIRLELINSENLLKDTLNSLSTYKNQCAEYDQKIKYMMEKMIEIKAQRDCKEFEAKVADESLKNIHDKFMNLKEANDRMSHSLSQSSQRIGELQEQIESIKEERSAYKQHYERQISEQSEKFQIELNNNWISKVDYETKCAELEKALSSLQAKGKAIELMEKSEALKLVHMEEELQNRLEQIKFDKTKLNNKLIDKENECKSICKELDALTLQISQITIDRTRILNEKIKLEKELTSIKSMNEKAFGEMQLRISELERVNADIRNKLITLQTSSTSMNQFVRPGSDISSDEGRSVDRLCISSPDLGIESDQGNSNTEVESLGRPLIKSLELTECMNNLLDFEQGSTNTDRITALEKENVELRKKQVRMRRTLEEALSQILAANKRKKQVEKDITAQLCKTHGVLRQVRTNLESEPKDNK